MSAVHNEVFQKDIYENIVYSMDLETFIGKEKDFRDKFTSSALKYLFGVDCGKNGITYALNQINLKDGKKMVKNVRQFLSSELVRSRHETQGITNERLLFLSRDHDCEEDEKRRQQYWEDICLTKSTRWGSYISPRSKANRRNRRNNKKKRERADAMKKIQKLTSGKGRKISFDSTPDGDVEAIIHFDSHGATDQDSTVTAKYGFSPEESNGGSPEKKRFRLQGGSDGDDSNGIEVNGAVDQDNHPVTAEYEVNSDESSGDSPDKKRSRLQGRSNGDGSGKDNHFSFCQPVTHPSSLSRPARVSNIDTRERVCMSACRTAKQHSSFFTNEEETSVRVPVVTPMSSPEITLLSFESTVSLFKEGKKEVTKDTLRRKAKQKIDEDLNDLSSESALAVAQEMKKLIENPSLFQTYILAMQNIDEKLHTLSAGMKGSALDICDRMVTTLEKKIDQKSICENDTVTVDREVHRMNESMRNQVSDFLKNSSRGKGGRRTNIEQHAINAVLCSVSSPSQPDGEDEVGEHVPGYKLAKHLGIRKGAIKKGMEMRADYNKDSTLFKKIP